MIRLLCLISLMLTACHTAPIVMAPDGTKVSLGTSLLEKTTDEGATVKLANGTEISYYKKGKDETMIAREGVRAWATVAGIVATAEGLNAGEAIRENGMTARQASTDSVKKAETAADVTKATFVPPEP